MGVVISGMIFKIFLERLIGVKRVKAQNGRGDFDDYFFKKRLIGIKRAREQNGVYDHSTIFMFFLKKKIDEI